jgi:hypothetical protein
MNQEPEEWLSSYWPSWGSGRIDAKNVTIVFSGGLFNANPGQPGRQGQRMPKTINHAQRKGRPMVATRRTLIWIEGSRFQGSGCSECAWVFTMSEPPAGDSLVEMMEKYERRRDREFAAHVCSEHPRSRNAMLK